jgi:lipoyl(octanoyl) transferase
MSLAAASTAEEGARASRGKPLVPAPVIRHLGRAHYESTWHAMQKFTAERDAASADEIWFLEHAPIFTLGMNASRAHLVSPGDIPVLQIDRGGEVTYHGPGQLVVYPLIDLKRAALGVRDLVSALEASVVNYVAALGIAAQCRRDAPGVYVGQRKLASLGIRIRRGASYHGLALNVDMDLEPFARIHPCGFTGLQMTQLADLDGPSAIEVVAQDFAPHLLRALFANVEVAKPRI